MIPGLVPPFFAWKADVKKGTGSNLRKVEPSFNFSYDSSSWVLLPGEEHLPNDMF